MNTPLWREHPVVFDCAGCRLIGIVTLPETPATAGVVIVVGGPQYRAGSHRQFTLLARHLADQGIASIRFDYRGMGDSEGEMRNFEAVDADIRAAVETLEQHAPALRRIALWGLCDAASAALYYAPTDPRISDLVLLNPWVHSAAGAARVQLKHYYLSRLMQRSFWAKLFSGKLRLAESAQSLASATRLASPDAASVPTDPRHGGPGYVERMFEGLKQFRGNILFLLSGNDYTAKEFLALTQSDKRWKKTCRSAKIKHETVKDANHTFSARTWRAQVETHTAQCLRNSDKRASK
jgi:exosortase A-associated hydrolase 1